MNLIEAIFLGVVQGLTEFLPVSSSGHLVLFQNLLGFEEPELLFDVCVHVGTLAAIMIVFFPQVVGGIQGFLRLVSALPKGEAGGVFKDDQDARMAVLILAGTIPTGLLGMGFHKFSGQLFSSPPLAGAMLIVTGFILWAVRMVGETPRTIKDMKTKDALIVGAVQGLAVMPGISRSGSTITAALFLGVDRETAARFSFLLSIPAILGALILESTDLGANSGPPIEVLAAGVIASAVSGYAALRLLMRIVRKGSLWWFAPYCWTLGAIVLGYSLFAN